MAILMYESGFVGTLTNLLEDFKVFIQNMADTFNALGVGNVEVNELNRLPDGRKFVEDKIYSTYEPSDIGGIPVTEDFIRSQIQMPNGYAAYAAAINAYKERLEELMNYDNGTYKNHMRFEFFKATYSEDEITISVIDSGPFDTVMKQYGYRVYAESEAEISLYNKINNLCEVLNDFQDTEGRGIIIEDAFGDYGLRTNQPIRCLGLQNPIHTPKEYIVNHRYVKANAS